METNGNQVFAIAIYRSEKQDLDSVLSFTLLLRSVG